MRGVQNRTHRKTSSHPEEVPYKPRASGPSASANKALKLPENRSGKPLFPPLLYKSPLAQSTLDFLCDSDRTRKKPKQ